MENNKQFKSQNQKLNKAGVGVKLSICVYIFLAITKIVISKVFNSESLFADGLNNFTDILGTLSVAIGIHFAKKPSDKEHTYGHFKIETISSLVTSFIMFMVGGMVLREIIVKIIKGNFTNVEPFVGFIALGFSGVLFFTYLFNIKLSRKTESNSLKAVAKDNLSDAIVSVGAAVSIFANFFHLRILDTCAGFVIAIIILYIAFQVFKESVFFLSDGINVKQLKKYKKVIKEVKGVENVVNIRGRLYGSAVFLDITVSVNGKLTVYESHKIANNVENVLTKKYNIFHSQVHIEPW